MNILEQENHPIESIQDLALYHQISQFYYREARILDNRQFQTWMKLLAPDIEYTIPARNNVMMDVGLKNLEQILNVEQEINTEDEVPFRADNMITLSLRANRPTNPIAWADNPLTRTCRHVSNIEVYEQGKDEWIVYSNVLMTYSRHSDNNFTFSCRRQDSLQRIEGEFMLAKRKVVLDWNTVTAPTLAILF